MFIIILLQTDSEEILTYEEIAKYYPQPNRKRPIVLIGPSNVGRNELQQRLLDTDPDRFGTPIPRMLHCLLYLYQKVYLQIREYTVKDFLTV